jgi:predicted kinase
MAMYKVLQDFYKSKEWINLRLLLINERGNVCQHCGEIIHNANEIIAHHIIELTPDNVNDNSIALNPDNILLVHHKCHNEIHKRFGYQQKKKVFVVYGPPLSGKKTYVKKYIQRRDIVIDMDRLYEAVTMSKEKPNCIFYNVIGVYNQLVDNVKTRYGKWQNAFIIGTLADKYKRNKLIQELGAEGIYIKATKEECLVRAKDKEGYDKYINKWFDTYSE